MNTKAKWLRQIPSVIISSGILLATLVGKLAVLGGWKMLLSALTMASAILGADVVNSMLRYGVVAVSWGGVLLSSGFLIAVWICRESSLAIMLIPTSGAIAWMLLQGKSTRAGKLCKLY